jgi:hypothetical protein
MTTPNQNRMRRAIRLAAGYECLGMAEVTR